MNRRVMFSSLIAGAATATLAPAAFGAAQWCEDDPLVVITTPTGYRLPLHVTNYVQGEENLKYIQRIPDNLSDTANPWISWTVVQSKQGGRKPTGAASTAVQWDVTIYVTIHTDPEDDARFRTKTVASSDLNGRGVRYAEAQGMSDRRMQLRFSMWA